MCEVGVWRSFDELEQSLCLDELLTLHEKTIERQKRVIETIAAAFGATEESSEINDIGLPIGDVRPVGAKNDSDLKGEEFVRPWSQQGAVIAPEGSPIVGYFGPD